MEKGRADWAVSWTGPSRLIAADIASDELIELVGAAADQPGTEVARLRLHLAALGLDPAAEAPARSLLQARAQSPAGLKAGPRGQAGNVRIVAGADLVTAQRVSTIRMLNIAVGVITGLVSLVGVHAWHSSHAPPTFAGFSPASGFGNPPPIPNPLATPWTGITSLPSPYPLPASACLPPLQPREPSSRGTAEHPRLPLPDHGARAQKRRPLASPPVESPVSGRTSPSPSETPAPPTEPHQRRRPR